jgi:hypothetical protein
MSELSSFIYFILMLLIRILVIPFIFFKRNFKGSRKMKKLKRLYLKTNLIWKFEKLFFTSVLSLYYENALIFFSSVLYIKSPLFGLSSFVFTILRGSFVLIPFYFSFRFKKKEKELKEYTEEMIKRTSKKKIATFITSFQKSSEERVKNKDHMLTIALIVYRKSKQETLSEIENKLGKKKHFFLTNLSKNL